ncbi:MAG: hypothetical protein V3S81_03585 [Anaerolineales bacterium]
MADIRCPMCSKSNPEDAEVCGVCGARLKPLVIDQPPQEQPPGQAEEPRTEQGAEQEEGLDWLGRIRTEAESEVPDDEIEPEETTDEAVSPDWLGRLREVDITADEGPPDGEVPDWLSAFSEDVGEVREPEGEEQEWLDRIREKKETEAIESEEEAEPVDDWLARLREDEELVPESLGADEITPEEFPLPAEIPAEEEVEEQVISPIEPMDISMEPSEAAPLDVVEDEEASPEPIDVLPEPTEVAPLEVVEDEEASPELIDVLPEPIEAAPLDVVEDEEAPPEPLDILPDPIEVAPPAVPSDFELPSEIEGEVEEVEARVDEFETPIEDELPHVPALILDEEEAIGEQTPDLDLDSIQLPGWLNELRETTPQEEVPAEDVSQDLAPATLPSWLEAMRPVETFRSAVEIESMDEQVVESAGPLAGLQGVLMAEPVVAIPRSATVGAARLEVTERQYAQAELLHRIVEEEDQERPPATVRRIRLPFLRWVIGLLLIIAVVLPTVLSFKDGEGFPLPSYMPRDLGTLFSVVEEIPPERPVLTVFDYTPGYAGELNTVAGPLLEHIILRGLKVVTVSTQPTGSPLAEGLLSRVGVNGENYVHLGYLSGGSTAVQLFTAAPRETISRGFLLPDDMESESGWQSPILHDVMQLSDFSLMVVITASTDSARTWVEQAYPWKGETPLVMVLSVGTEPLIRPYYEALEPQVDGILTGLPAAVTYEQYLGRSGEALALWNAFGAGMLTVELILLAGVIYGAAIWLVRPRTVETRSEHND